MSVMKARKEEEVTIYKSLARIERSFTRVLQTLPGLQQQKSYQSPSMNSAVRAVREARAGTLFEVLEILHSREEREWTRWDRKGERLTETFQVPAQIREIWTRSPNMSVCSRGSASMNAAVRAVRETRTATRSRSWRFPMHEKNETGPTGVAGESESGSLRTQFGSSAPAQIVLRTVRSQRGRPTRILVREAPLSRTPRPTLLRDPAMPVRVFCLPLCFQSRFCQTRSSGRTRRRAGPVSRSFNPQIAPCSIHSRRLQ